MRDIWHRIIIFLIFFYSDLYCVAFQKDRRVHKLIVLILVLLETTQTAALTHDVILHYTAAYTDPVALDETATLWISIPMMVGLSTYIIFHDFFEFSLTLLGTGIW